MTQLSSDGAKSEQSEGTGITQPQHTLVEITLEDLDEVRKD